jgi:hypothetical protein
VRERLAAVPSPESTRTEVDEFLSDRAGYWASAMAEDGPPVRVDLPSVLQKLRRPS